MVGRRLATALVALTAGVGTAVSSPASSSAAQPTSGAKYEYQAPGLSVDNVSFRVARDGASLRDIWITLSVSCTNGREAIGLFIGLLSEPPARLEIASDGTFSGSLPVDAAFLNPFAASEEYQLSGRFIRRGKAARITVRSRHVGEAGTVCDSGDVQGTARRAKPKRRG